MYFFIGKKSKSGYFLDFRSDSEQDSDPVTSRNGSEDRDPYKNETDPQHCLSTSLTKSDQNDPDNRFEFRNKCSLRIRIHDGLKIDQGLPFSYADNFSATKSRITFLHYDSDCGAGGGPGLLHQQPSHPQATPRRHLSRRYSRLEY